MIMAFIDTFYRHVAGDFNPTFFIIKYVKSRSYFKYNVRKPHDTNQKLTHQSYVESGTTIYYILAKSYTETIFKIEILNCDVSNQFLSCFIIKAVNFPSKNKVIYIYKISFNEESIINFKNKFFEIYI